MVNHVPITDALITKIQVATHAHSRTVMRRMLGLPVRGKVAERVDEELGKVGCERPTTKAPPEKDPPILIDEGGEEYCVMLDGSRWNPDRALLTNRRALRLVRDALDSVDPAGTVHRILREHAPWLFEQKETNA